ncbi:hypothetical protein AB0L68_14390 [Streptomyces sp. NPDC052164]|uniref:hypothetical protein n=1 Tax=Streptomyces sp. NPDC052164 TaxID=3155529 RepID=UPI0034475837
MAPTAPNSSAAATPTGRAAPPAGRPVLRHPASAAVERGFFSPMAAYADGRTPLMRPTVGGATDEEEKAMPAMVALGD